MLFLPLPPHPDQPIKALADGQSERYYVNNFLCCQAADTCILFIFFSSFPFASSATWCLLIRVTKLSKYRKTCRLRDMYSAGSKSSVTLCDHLFYGRASFCLADAELTVNVWVDVCNCQMGWGGGRGGGLW